MAVFTRYQSEHANQTRSRTAVEKSKNLLLDFLGNEAKVGDFTRARQRDFLRELRSQGYAVSSCGLHMTLIQAAFNYAAAEEEDDGRALLTRAPRLLYTVRDVSAVLKEAEPEPRNWHPDLDMIAEFLNGLLPEEEPLRRFTVFKLAFACRSEAALEAGPFLLDKRYRTIRLNPPGRRQTKKHRPTLPVPSNLWPVLEQWSDHATFAYMPGRNGTPHITGPWGKARTRIGLPPEFIPNSLRHFMATAFRHAHLDYGVPRVPVDEREMWLGHRRASTHNTYGAFEPDYLEAAKTAVEAILDSLNAKLKTPLFRQVSAKTPAGKQRIVGLNLLRKNDN